MMATDSNTAHLYECVAFKRKNKNLRKMIIRDFNNNKYLYLMALPVVLFYIIFEYGPMYGAQIAFRDFTPALGITESPWVGVTHFIEFFESRYFWRLIRNGILLNLYDVVFGFPVPIILALLINELKNNTFKRITQTVVYMPHFISMIVVAGMIRDFVAMDGVINDLIDFFGGERSAILQRAELFRAVFVGSNIWQGAGWGSIIYLAALSNIDPQLYEASTIDGCSRFNKIRYITLPGIMPTIVVMFILRMGSMLNVGFEKIILLYNPLTFETADVISSYVFRRGLLEFDWSFSAAVGLFNSFINFFLVYTANWINRRVNENSLW